MKASLLQENLLGALLSLSRIVPTRAQLPALQNILIQSNDNRLKLTATSLEATLVRWCDGKIEEEGQVCVPSRVLSEFVATLPAQTITLAIEEGGLVVSCEGFKATLATSPTSEFPPAPAVGKTSTTTLPAREFSTFLGQVLFAAATDEARPILSGVRFTRAGSETVIIATDGYRLSRKSVSFKIKDGADVVVPARALGEVVRLCKESGEEDTLSFAQGDDGQLVFVVGEAELYTRRIDGEYPSVDKIIPKTHTTRLVVDRETMTRAIKSAAIFARDNANIVRFSINKNDLTVSANAPSVGENKIDVDAKVEGEGGEIAFNSRFLLEYLSAVSGDQISFEMTGSLNPGAFRLVGDDSFLHIIMPVRVQA